ncbi:MAG: hypothetical protein JWQ32_3658, partial [Marmoricola sp.]|nr:hypothetical protein [Marmoricola sp.]
LYFSDLVNPIFNPALRRGTFERSCNKRTISEKQRSICMELRNGPCKGAFFGLWVTCPTDNIHK